MKRCFIFGLIMVLFCSKENVPKDGVISVDGKWITKTEIEKVVDMYRQQMMQIMPQQALEAVPPEVRKNIAMQLVASELALKEGKKRGIRCDSAKFDKTFTGITKQFPDKATMQKELAKMGQTEQTLREQLCDGLIVDSLMKTIYNKSDTATTEECKAYYDANTQQFASEKKVKASQILLLTKKEMTPDQKKILADKAKSILQEIRGGKDFAACAKKYSQDPNAAQGGDVGWFKKGDTKPEIERAAFGMKDGEVSDVFETDVGFHIIKKTGEETLPPKKFEDVRPQIGNMLSLKKQNDVVKAFVDGLMAKAKITYADTAYQPIKEPAAPAPVPSAPKEGAKPSKEPAAAPKK
jgi:peptidyl-prolyl cis-trans isomerase C